MFKKWFTRVRAIKRCLDQAHVVVIDFVSWLDRLVSRLIRSKTFTYSLQISWNATAPRWQVVSRRTLANMTGKRYALLVAPGDHWVHWPDRCSPSHQIPSESLHFAYWLIKINRVLLSFLWAVVWIIQDGSTSHLNLTRRYWLGFGAGFVTLLSHCFQKTNEVETSGMSEFRSLPRCSLSRFFCVLWCALLPDALAGARWEAEADQETCTSLQARSKDRSPNRCARWCCVCNRLQGWVQDEHPSENIRYHSERRVSSTEQSGLSNYTWPFSLYSQDKALSLKTLKHSVGFEHLRVEGPVGATRDLSPSVS